jgi:hypothetical protein
LLFVINVSLLTPYEEAGLAAVEQDAFSAGTVKLLSAGRRGLHSGK